MGSNIYNHTQIEEKWQAVWEEQQLFQGSQQQRTNTQPKSYLLFAFAYPSGSGLHVGHVESKTALDILARHARMHGERVFFPVGWDAFGLPAENYAIKTGVPPAETTRQAINTFRRQLKRIGISYDWANEIATSHPEYYRWTQWIFLQLFNKGLAYQATAPVNWCPSCQTVLANEQVVSGECERCGADVIQKEMKQWFFKISEYRDELISGLDQVDWPSATKQQQLHWIGKSEGVVVRFLIEDSNIQLECFTTRVDTIYGVSFIAISPEKFEELALFDRVDSQRQQAVQHYLDQAKKKTEEQRKIGEKEKTGVNIGLTAINPVNGEQIPLFIADYVLAGYGTGVVMGVPAHDERDFAFARKYDLQIKEVVQPLSVIQPIQEVTGRRIAQGVNATSNLYTTFGALINSGPFSGMTSEEAQVKIPEHFSDAMEQTTTYKLRDWLISRQRYWGTPIPIVYDPEGNAHPVRQEHLPWTLPTDVEFKPTGESPLTHSLELKERVERLYGKGWTPEYDTMDTFVDSSWYYLRYVDARNTQTFASSESLANWLPVDMYMIGPEHIVLHLLYSRFFTKFLRDQGYLTFDEPFLKMRHQGMILGPDGRKMSKSKGNVINPDEVIEKFGADTLRVYEMFMGPIDADKPWNTNSVVGIYRFLSRVYALVTGQLLADGEQLDPQSHQKLHQTISKVSSDITDLKFNTAIAAMMECVNTWEAATKAAGGRVLSLEDIAAFIQILSPFAPFLGEELWQQAGNATSVHLSSWPIVDESALSAQECVIVVQVNGKLRDQMVVQADQADDRALLVSLAKQQAKVVQYLSGGTILKEIVVPKKLVNFVLA